MKRWLAIGLALMCACDKLADHPDDTADPRNADMGLREEAARYTTTQGTMTVNDQELVARFPLPIMPDAKLQHVARHERPGQPTKLQISFDAPGTLRHTSDFYESAMRGKGMRVQSTASVRDPDQIILMGDGALASATAMLNRKPGGETTSVALSWTNKLSGAQATSSAPANRN